MKPLKFYTKMIKLLEGQLIAVSMHQKFDCQDTAQCRNFVQCFINHLQATHVDKTAMSKLYGLFELMLTLQMDVLIEHGVFIDPGIFWRNVSKVYFEMLEQQI